MAVQQHDRSVPEVILLWFLQVLGAVTAILFGVFGALSWQAAKDADGLSDKAFELSKEANRKADVAKSQADSANLVALLALCDQISEAESVCQRLPLFRLQGLALYVHCTY